MSTPATTLQHGDGAREHVFVVHDPWGRMLLLALVRRYGLAPHRRRGQHRSTIRVHAPQSVVENALWPHFQAAHRELDRRLCEVTRRMVAETVDAGDRAVRQRAVTPLCRRQAQ